MNTLHSFLDFFYKRLKPFELAKGTDPAFEQKHHKLKQAGYTFVSLCGPERNYIRSQDTPIVFRELIQQDSDCKSTHILLLFED